MATTTRSRTSATKTPAARKRAPRAAASSTPTAASVKRSATTAKRRASSTVKDLRSSASKAIQSVPVNRTTVSIGIGALAAAALAGIAAYLGRDRITQIASTSRDKLSDATASSRETLKNLADDVSQVAHDKIDQARDNITKLRGRANSVDVPTEYQSTVTGSSSALAS